MAMCNQWTSLFFKGLIHYYILSRLHHNTSHQQCAVLISVGLGEKPRLRGTATTCQGYAVLQDMQSSFLWNCDSGENPDPEELRLSQSINQNKTCSQEKILLMGALEEYLCGKGWVKKFCLQFMAKGTKQCTVS